MVYSNVLDDTDQILSAIKQSEIEENQNKYYINKWGKWSLIGTSTQLKSWLFSLSNGSIINCGDESDDCCNKKTWFLLEKNKDSFSHDCDMGINENKVPPEDMEWFKNNKYSLANDKDSIDQRLALNNIRKAYKKVLLDYIKDWGQDQEFDKVNNFNFKDGSWMIPNLGILHHSKSPDEYAMAMTYHTDKHQFDSERGGDHFVLTITMYLNNDFEGGELTFLDANKLDVIHYRPKAGDITIFPSYAPYFHGVEKVESGDRYLARTFLSRLVKPSDLWEENAKRYGKEEYEKMEKERISNEYNSPEYFKLAIYTDDEFTINDGGDVYINKYPKTVGMPFYVDKKRGYYKN